MFWKNKEVGKHAPVRTASDARGRRRKTGRTAVYAVRVGGNFKSEVLALQAQIQLEQCGAGLGRKITEGEVVELMLAALKAARRNTEEKGAAVSLADDVWAGVRLLAGHLNTAPQDVIEQLVVQKLTELGLLLRT